MQDLIAAIVGFALLAGLIGLWIWPAAWAVGDAQRRGQTGGVPIFLFWLLGPLSALVWLMMRPRTRLAERPPASYENADEALAAAARLTMLGDWDAAIALYQDAAGRWPQHEHYIGECIKEIKEKQALTRR